jgi:O-antigen/teichoic acid export membrane protein
MIAKRLKKLGVGADIGISVLFQVLAAALAFAFQTIILRSMSKDDSGSYFLILSYITIASGLGDFGLLATITPRLSVARDESTPAFKAAFALRAVMLMVSLLLLNIYLMIIGQDGLLLYVNVAYISVLISSKATGIRQLFELVWRLRGRTYVITAIGVVDIVLGLLALWLLHHFGEVTLLRAVTIFSLCNIPGCLVVAIPLIGRFRRAGTFTYRVPARYYRAIFVAALPVGLMGLLGQTSGQLETLVIEASTVMTRADIAAYNAGIRPLLGSVFIATAFSFGLVPIVAQYAKGVRSDHSFEFIISLGLRILGMIGLGVSVVCFLFAEPIMTIFGAQFAHDAYILRIYSIINGLTYLVVMFDQFLLATGRRKQTLYGALIYFLLALVLEPVTIRQWGIRGMMYAKLIAICCLIAFQITRFPREIRLAALGGMSRLLPSVVVFGAGLAATASLGTWTRGAIVAGLVAAVALGTRTVKLGELKALKTMRIT